jgi:hypothetical protein
MRYFVQLAISASLERWISLLRKAFRRCVVRPRVDAPNREHSASALHQNSASINPEATGRSGLAGALSIPQPTSMTR